jgi:hypothetical protein
VTIKTSHAIHPHQAPVGHGSRRGFSLEGIRLYCDAHPLADYIDGAFELFTFTAGNAEGQVIEQRCGALQRRLLIIFQYWFARRSVEMGVRPRKPGRTRWRVAAYFACVHALQRGYRRDCNDHAKSDRK